MPFNPRNWVIKYLIIADKWRCTEATKTLIITTLKESVRLIGDRFEKKPHCYIYYLHEIGHAIRIMRITSPSDETDIIKKTSWLSRLSNTLMLFAVPTVLFRCIFLLKICVTIILISTLIGLFTHLITLEVERCKF